MTDFTLSHTSDTHGILYYQEIILTIVSDLPQTTKN